MRSVRSRGCAAARTEAEIAFPRPPTPPPRRRLAWVAVALPAVGGVLMAVVLHTPTFLFFALLSPVVALGTWLSERWSGRRSRRREQAEARRRRCWRRGPARRGGGRRRPGDRGRRTRPRRRSPGGPAPHPARCGAGRAGRCGRADRPASAPVRAPRRSSGSTADGSRSPVPAPRTCRSRSTSARGGLAVVGPRERALGVLSAVLAQLTALHAPGELDLLLLPMPRGCGTGAGRGGSRTWHPDAPSPGTAPARRDWVRTTKPSHARLTGDSPGSAALRCPASGADGARAGMARRRGRPPRSTPGSPATLRAARTPGCSCSRRGPVEDSRCLSTRCCDWPARPGDVAVLSRTGTPIDRTSRSTGLACARRRVRPRPGRPDPGATASALPDRGAAARPAQPRACASVPAAGSTGRGRPTATGCVATLGRTAPTGRCRSTSAGTARTP